MRCVPLDGPRYSSGRAPDHSVTFSHSLRVKRSQNALNRIIFKDRNVTPPRLVNLGRVSAVPSNDSDNVRTLPARHMDGSTSAKTGWHPLVAPLTWKVGMMVDQQSSTNNQDNGRRRADELQVGAQR